jgi:hypothetical protein
MSAEGSNADLDGQFESLNLQSEPLSSLNSTSSSNSNTSNTNAAAALTNSEPVKTSENGKRNRKREKDKSKDSVVPTTTAVPVSNEQVISQQPTKQQAQSKPGEIKARMLDMDENGFLNEDILEQQQKQFAQYEQKVNQMQEDEEEPFTPLPAGEQHHQQHPQNKYDYEESILLVNEFEQMQVSSPEEFCEQLGFDLKDSNKSRYANRNWFFLAKQ